LSALYGYITIHGINNIKFVVIKSSDLIRIRNPIFLSLLPEYTSVSQFECYSLRLKLL